MANHSVADPRPVAEPSIADLPVSSRRHPLRWITAAIALLLIAQLIGAVVGNPGFAWPVVAEYIFSPPILDGLQTTLFLTVVCMIVGIVLGALLAIMRLSSDPTLRWFVISYTWLFRGTPVLVQLIFIYNLSALFPTFSLSIPFGPALLSVPSNAVITTMVAAVLGLGLNEAANMSEIIRGGILGIDKGQTEAAKAIGMTQGLILRRVILPQAARLVIPPTGNQVIGMLKYTSLVSVIALGDLLYNAEHIYSRNFQPIPLLIVVTFWYLLATSVLMVGQQYLERVFSPGSGSPRTRQSKVSKEGQTVE